MVETEYGKICGVEHETYTEYRGIPYAKAPVGELRWKAPREPEPWTGIMEAVNFANTCMQDPPSMQPTDRDFHSNPQYERPFSEDCLYLNIWVPKYRTEEKMPVMFWIHGGAYLGGSASEIEFDGKSFCEHGIILVSIEYRCNVFGFLAHPWLSAENQWNASGNYGMLDQIAALKWVYKNIEAFGGDPERITAAGQSAGAMSVQALVSSPLSKHMIHGAIMQSGGSYAGGILTDLTVREAEKYGTVYTDILGVESVQELRTMPAEKILSALGPFIGRTMGMGKGMFKLIPNIDGCVLTDTYDHLIEQGQLPKIPYMLGTTANDILVTEQMAAEGKFSELYKGCIRFGQKMHELGSEPVYVYYFTRKLPGDQYGAWHSAELWYMFDTMDRCWRPWEQQDYDLRDRMVAYWTNFVKCGDPNGDGNCCILQNLEKWKPCEDPQLYVQQLN